MTSPASLPTDARPAEQERRFAPLRHYILWTFRRYGWLFFVGVLIFSVLSFVLLSLYSNRPGFFYLIHPDNAVAMRAATALFGWLVAYVLFGYLWNRRESGAYGCLGISRKKQFAIRYGCGLATVALSIALPLIVSYILDMRDMGGDPYGVCAHYTLVYTLSLVVLGWLSFTVFAVVTGLCGRRSTALLCGIGVMGAPYSVALAAQMLIRTYLLGSPLGAWGAPYAEEFPNLFSKIGQDVGLLTLLSEPTDAIFLNAGILSDTASAQYLKDMRPLPVVYLLVLLALTALLALLAGFIVVRRRAERAGQVYVHAAPAYLTALAVGVGAGALTLLIPLRVGTPLSLVLAALIFMVTLAVVTVLLVWALTRTWRQVRRTLPVMGGMIGICLVLVACLSLGWFGYADAVPAAEDIREVRVSYNQNPITLANLPHSGFSSGLWQGDRIDGVDLTQYDTYYAQGYEIHWDALPALTSAGDIEIVRSIHQALIEDGLRPYVGESDDYSNSVVRACYTISYTLKSGEVVTRYYENLSLHALEATLQIDETDAMRALMADVHTNTRPDEAAIVISDALYTTQTMPELTDEEYTALLAALDADYADLSVEERYFPRGAEVMGIVYLTTKADAGGQLMSHPSERNNEAYYITDAYTRTLAFLSERDLLRYMTAGDYTVRAVLAQPYTVRLVKHEALSYHFFSSRDVVGLDGKRTETVTALPESAWAETIAASTPTTLHTRAGRLILIVMDDAAGRRMVVTRFVPDAP